MKLKPKLKINNFKYFLIGILCLLFILLLPDAKENKNIVLDKNLNIEQNVLHIFIQQGCSHCEHLEVYLDKIKDDYSDIKFKYYDLAENSSRQFFFQCANQLKIDLKKVGTPLMVFCDEYMIGFSNEKERGQEIRKMLDKQKDKISKKEKLKKIKIPLFGEIDLINTSLPVLAILMGLADGFNPCAMWVLVYLISLCAGLQDRKKIWFLVGAFVFSSGILYFLFMTAWLNVFLYLGYVRLLAVAIGLFALYFGIMQVFEFIKNRGEVTCSLTNNEIRKGSIKKIDSLVKAELSLFSIFGIIVLAFVVNSIEFACSATLPAMFTFVLTQAHLSTLMHYFYIFLYTLFFMLDDFIIFGLATMAINESIGTKYSKYSGVIGGTLMVLIGIIIVFFPNMLR